MKDFGRASSLQIIVGFSNGPVCHERTDGPTNGLLKARSGCDLIQCGDNITGGPMDGRPAQDLGMAMVSIAFKRCKWSSLMTHPTADYLHAATYINLGKKKII